MQLGTFLNNMGELVTGEATFVYAGIVVIENQFLSDHCKVFLEIERDFRRRISNLLT